MGNVFRAIVGGEISRIKTDNLPAMLKAVSAAGKRAPVLETTEDGVFVACHTGGVDYLPDKDTDVVQRVEISGEIFGYGNLTGKPYRFNKPLGCFEPLRIVSAPQGNTPAYD